MKFRVGRAVAGTMAVAATLMATAGTASADIPPGIDWDHMYSAEGVRVYVEEHGDIISVCDTKANGHAAVVVAVDNNQHYGDRADSGNGTCTTHDAGDGWPYNLTENDLIHLTFGGTGSNNPSYASYVNDH